MPKKTKLASKRINSFLPGDVRGAINVLSEEFADTQNPLFMMHAFIRSVNAGIYPPVPMLIAIAKAFSEVLLPRGGKGRKRKTPGQALGQALGLEGVRSGAWDVFTNQKKENEAYSVALMIWTLTVGDEKMSVAAAAVRVHSFLEERAKHPRIIPRLGPYTSVEYLIDQYARSWKKRFHLATIERTSPLHPASWTPARRAAYLKHLSKPQF